MSQSQATSREPSASLQALLDVPLRFSFSADVQSTMDALRQSLRNTPAIRDWTPIYTHAVEAAARMVDELGGRLEELQTRTVALEEQNEERQRRTRSARRKAEKARTKAKSAIEELVADWVERTHRQREHVRQGVKKAQKRLSAIEGYLNECVERWTTQVITETDKSLREAITSALSVSRGNAMPTVPVATTPKAKAYQFIDGELERTLERHRAELERWIIKRGETWSKAIDAWWREDIEPRLSEADARSAMDAREAERERERLAETMTPLQMLRSQLAESLLFDLKKKLRAHQEGGTETEASLGLFRTSPPAATEPLKVFLSHANDDQDLRTKLEKHLHGMVRSNKIVLTHSESVKAGHEASRVVASHLAEAQVILLLISPSYLASDECYEDEIQSALARHEQGHARVIPVLLRPCVYVDAPFARLQAIPPFPTSREPMAVKSFGDIDEALCQVALAVREAVEAMRREPLT